MGILSTLHPGGGLSQIPTIKVSCLGPSQIPPHSGGGFSDNHHAKASATITSQRPPHFGGGFSEPTTSEILTQALASPLRWGFLPGASRVEPSNGCSQSTPHSGGGFSGTIYAWAKACGWPRKAHPTAVGVSLGRCVHRFRSCDGTRKHLPTPVGVSLVPIAPS